MRNTQRAGCADLGELRMKLLDLSRVAYVGQIRYSMKTPFVLRVSSMSEARRLLNNPQRPYLAPCIKSAPRLARRRQPSLRHGGCYCGDAALCGKGGLIA
jgi:hypothetical protein